MPRFIWFIYLDSPARTFTSTGLRSKQPENSVAAAANVRRSAPTREKSQFFGKKLSNITEVFQKSSFFQVFSATPGLKPGSSGGFSGFFSGHLVSNWKPRGFFFPFGTVWFQMSPNMACGRRRAGGGVRGQQKTHPFRSGF